MNSYGLMLKWIKVKLIINNYLILCSFFKK